MKLTHIVPLMTVTLSFAACAYAAPGKAEEAKMKAEAKITEKAAQKTALEAVSKGKVIESELEKENGLLVWSFDISKPGTKNITEIQVDAKTGKIVSNTVETEADQAKEKAQESGK